MYKKYGKRVLDVIVSLMVLGISIPLDLVVLFCTVVEIKENPIFVHKRMGKDGKSFNMYKFKSMTHKNGETKITKVGNIIRKTSIDELPQFINVLKGDMSIVGPRPYLVDYYDYLDKEIADLRLSELPGLTGLFQIRGRKRIRMDKALEYDLEYIDHLSFLNDVKIILGTFKALLDMDESVINFTSSLEEEYAYLTHLKLVEENGVKRVVYQEEKKDREEEVIPPCISPIEEQENVKKLSLHR